MVTKLYVPSHRPPGFIPKRMALSSTSPDGCNAVDPATVLQSSPEPQPQQRSQESPPHVDAAASAASLLELLKERLARAALHVRLKAAVSQPFRGLAVEYHIELCCALHAAR